MPARKSSKIGFDEFLDSCTDVCSDIRLSFANVGTVAFTTLTRANLELLRWATSVGAPGIIISCPDYERESIAVAFLGAFQHLIEAKGCDGAHEPIVGERAAIGELVVEITKVEQDTVLFKTGDSRSVTTGRRRDLIPSVHRAAPGERLSRTKGKLDDTLAQIRNMPPAIKRILDQCGNKVPAVGYITSNSQYLNEAPTRVLKGDAVVDGTRIPLSQLLPITYLPSKGKQHSGFKWPYDVTPSILVCPREYGIGSGLPLVDYYREGGSVDFVAMDISGPETLETGLFSDILDFVDEGIGIIGFCDRWTMDKVTSLKERGFLLFDWNDCKAAEKASNLSLSRVQHSTRKRGHEIVFSVPEGETKLSRAKSILYDKLDNVDFYTEEAMRAHDVLLRMLSSALRRTEVPDETYCTEQVELIDDAVEAIEETRILSPEDFNELCEARDILKRLYRPGIALPKEDEIYNRIADGIEAGKRVLLVVDRSHTIDAYEYWCDELRRNGYPTDSFNVLNTLEFMAEKGIKGNELVLFSGWYDRGTMDRALHSGIVSEIAFVLYNDGHGGLEIEWYKKAKEAWRRSSEKCAKETAATLRRLGIEGEIKPIGGTTLVPSKQDDKLEADRDESLASKISDVEKLLLQKDVARSGERAIDAIPVLFDDGTHVWLRAARKNRGQGGTLMVITDCLVGQDDEPARKPASSVLRGDVVLRTHSNKDFIRRTSEAKLNSYDDVRSIAERWRAPILEAQQSKMGNSEIVSSIRAHMKTPRSEQTIREWVVGNRIAPRRKSDVQAVFEAFGKRVSDSELDLIMRAAARIRGQHMSAGSIATETMVGQFLEDVKAYGVDDAVAGFASRHDSGRVDLLHVTAVGKQMQVSADRVAVI